MNTQKILDSFIKACKITMVLSMKKYQPFPLSPNFGTEWK